MAPIIVEAGGWEQPRHKQHTAALPDCSSLTGLLMAEPVRAASVDECEARKRDIRLRSSSFKHFDDSPSFRDRITRSCIALATHRPDSVCKKQNRYWELVKWGFIEHLFTYYIYDNSLVKISALNCTECALVVCFKLKKKILLTTGLADNTLLIK